MSVDNKIMSHHSVKCSFRRHFAQSDNLKIWWVFKTFCFFFHLSFVHICRFWRTHSKGRFSTLQSLAIFHLKYWWIRPNIRAPIRNILVRMLLFDLTEFNNFHSSQRLCELDKMFSVQSEKKTNLIWNYSHFHIITCLHTFLLCPMFQTISVDAPEFHVWEAGALQDLRLGRFGSRPQ